MNDPVKEIISNFNNDELRTLIVGVYDIMYPDDDKEPEWSTDELPKIASFLRQFGICPTRQKITKEEAMKRLVNDDIDTIREWVIRAENAELVHYVWKALMAEHPDADHVEEEYNNRFSEDVKVEG